MSFPWLAVFSWNFDMMCKLSYFQLHGYREEKTVKGHHNSREPDGFLMMNLGKAPVTSLKTMKLDLVVMGRLVKTCRIKMFAFVSQSWYHFLIAIKVYKGTLSNGQYVAIKRSQQGSMQGGVEFKTEIELLSRVHHKNLVSLVGFCFEQREQMLVYEYISNGTLRESLSGSKK